MNDTYKTIEKAAEGIYKEKGSKFLAFAYPVFSESEASEKLDSLKKEFHDARHHCFAYRLGADMKKYRVNDDGEPSNSAGPPILRQIKSKHLTNIIIIVVRYFGGTLLGVGGLINAYKTAAADALNNASLITKTVNKKIIIHFEYPDMNDVMTLVKEENLKQIEQAFELHCKLEVEVRKSDYIRIKKRLEKIPSVSLE